MNSAEAKAKLASDPDFVAIKRFDYSLKKLLERYPIEKYPEGVPVRVMAQALLLTEDEVEDEYERAILKMRMLMNVDLSD